MTQYQSPSVMKNENWLMVWDRTVLTDHIIQANQPDIVLRDKRKKKVWLIGMDSLKELDVPATLSRPMQQTVILVTTRMVRDFMGEDG